VVDLSIKSGNLPGNNTDNLMDVHQGRQHTMATNHDSYLQRHSMAMLNPATRAEQDLADGFTQLARMADRYGTTPEGRQAVGLQAKALLLILQLIDNPGRIGKNALDKQVRDVVRRTGGDADNL
jgi:hypothetical protein